MSNSDYIRRAGPGSLCPTALLAASAGRLDTTITVGGCYYDELRMTVSAPRYTADFPIATEPFFTVGCT